MKAKTILLALAVPAVLTISALGSADHTPVRTARQTALHEAADILRAAGYTDDGPEISALSAAWWREKDDLDVIARVVYGEARGCPREHQIAVAAVVVNRVNDPRFPSTVREVVAAPRQYTTAYLGGFNSTTWECYEAARIAMDGEDGVPDDIVWQAEFPQGNETWWVSEVDTGYYASTTYFCR